MTEYLANQQVNVDGFLNATQNQIKIVAPNGTINRIENPSFEMPVFNAPNGTLSQWNWSYNGSPQPVTFEHAYAGSYSWKSRMNTNASRIEYGTERMLQPSTETGYRDILSFYYYGIVDTKTSTTYTVANYGSIIPEQKATFEIQIFGTNDVNRTVTYLVETRTFDVSALPKNNPGDLNKGISGSMVPHFYDWSRFTMTVSEQVKNYKYFYFRIRNTNLIPYVGFDFYLVLDAFQLEKQPYQTLATTYFDGSFDGFNTIEYPRSFQWTGEPNKSMSIRSSKTRSNGELVGLLDYCNFYLKSVNGLESPPENTKLFTKTLLDGQHFVEQITQSRTLSLSGRIIAETEAGFMESFARFQELLGKKPYAEPEPVRIFFELTFQDGRKLVPIHLDVVYTSGLELDTSNVFQSEIELNFSVISQSLLYQNDSSSNMFNDSPLFDQFNTMNVDILRDVGGFFYYNKTEEKWESPSDIAFYRHADNEYTSTLSYGGTGIHQRYEARDEFTVGNVYVIKEDKDGIIWFGGRFDVVEISAFYIDVSGDRQNVKARIHANNIVGLRRRTMSGEAFVYDDPVTITQIENGPNLVTVEYFSEWQVIPLLDAPTRYSLSNELAPVYLGIQGNHTVRAIEITPDGTMYIGGDFDFDYGSRHFSNILAFVPYGSDAQNVNLYIPQHMYSWVSVNLNTTSLLTQQGRGRRRAEWVNGSIPYCKYGVFTEIGHIGPLADTGPSAVYDIAYDDFNQCLYIGGTFTEVSNRNSMYVTFSVARFVKYSLLTKSFQNMGATPFGVDHGSLTVAATSVIRKILVQYTSNGVNVYVGGKFLTAGQTSDTVNTRGIVIFYIETGSNVAEVKSVGGGVVHSSDTTVSATIYDIVSTKDQRVYVCGDFNLVNWGIKPNTKTTGIAEYRNGLFVDVTRGLDANYYPDGYNALPKVFQMSTDSDNNIVFVGEFRNVKNKFTVDSIARWDGVEYSGLGLTFLPNVTKIMQSIYIDGADNIYLFTGPNTVPTTSLRTMYNDITSAARPTGVEIGWTDLTYSTLKKVFKNDYLDIQFLYYEIINDVPTYTAGDVNTAVRLDSSLSSNPELPIYASQDIIFIGGRFTHIKIADTMFRVNNLVALQYDQNQNPFPYKVITFSPGKSPYYDNVTGGEDSPFFGINVRDQNGVTNGAVFSIDIKTTVTNSGAFVIPTDIFVGGRFDFTARNKRYKNFVHITLQRNINESWIQLNANPENYEARMSVPYMNYGTYYSPGPCGKYGVNDAVYAVKASHEYFAGTLYRWDPKIVYIGGDFIEVTSGSTTMLASRLAVYNMDVFFHQYLTKKFEYYMIDFKQTGATPQGVQSGTAWNAEIYVKSIQYTPWYVSGGLTYGTSMIPMGKWTNAGGTPFVCGSNSITSGSPIAKIGIVGNVDQYIQDPFLQAFTTNVTGNVFTSSDYDYDKNIYVSGTFTHGGTANILRYSVSTFTTATITNNVVASTDWTNIYASSTGLAHTPSHVFRANVANPTLYFVGSSTTPVNLFADAIAIKYSSVNKLYAANYGYANVNIPQMAATFTDGLGDFNVGAIERRYRQTSTGKVGYPLAIPSADVRYTVSLPIQDYVNTMYDALPMQTFNCYNNGTSSVVPTIYMQSPFAGNVNTATFVHKIINVTTKQSLYLGLWLSPGEIIKIRTERERVSVISNVRGQLSNAILSSRNVGKNNTENGQIFRLVPGKNVIRYGPSTFGQRYFRSATVLSDVVYNANQNVIVPSVIITISWTMGFNSVHDALFTHTNPLLLR